MASPVSVKASRGQSTTTLITNTCLVCGVLWGIHTRLLTPTHCTPEYPKQGWVRRTNTLRQGIVISNFQTADKAVVEVFPEDARTEADLVYAAVERVLYPGAEVGGNSKLELPPRDRIKSQQVVLDGQVWNACVGFRVWRKQRFQHPQRYTYLAFTSDTLTRSGYQVGLCAWPSPCSARISAQIRRKNLAVVATRRKMCVVLCASARSDLYDAEKQVILSHIVESFRLR